MIKFENTEIFNINGALRGMRNPMDSWDKSDSYTENDNFIIGPEDMKLAKKLIKAGSCHRKFLRQIMVCVDITFPLTAWKEFDTYKVGTVANSCSTMHTIHKKPFTPDMFHCGELEGYDDTDEKRDICMMTDYHFFLLTLERLNIIRNQYLRTKDKQKWKAMINLLPTSFLQKRTVTMSYENLLAMCSKDQRRNHKLTEWSEAFVPWARNLPYARELIFGDETDIEFGNNRLKGNRLNKRECIYHTEDEDYDKYYFEY